MKNPKLQGMLVFKDDETHTFLFFADALRVEEVDATTGELIKVRPPLVKLPSFYIAAHILGYLTYQDEVRRLLNLSSRNCGRYLSTHRPILRKFVKVVIVLSL